LNGPGIFYLLLLGSLTVFIAGLYQAQQGYAQKAEAVRRGRLDRGERASRRLAAAADQRLRRTRAGRAVEAQLLAAGLEVATIDFLAIVLGGVMFAYLLVRLLIGPSIAVVAALLAVLAAFQYLRYRRGRRRDEFVAQLPEMARIMSNASSAGLAMPRAIEVAAGELGRPASDIMQRVIDELRLGQSVDRALENLEARMPSREVSVLVSTLVIQQRAGGDTVAALRGMADTLEARKDLRREVKTVMAGALASGWAVAAIGAGMLVIMNLIAPGILEQMAGVLLGRVALVVGLGLYSLGFVLIRRVTRIET
jgi:tight adherence protein B